MMMYTGSAGIVVAAMVATIVGAGFKPAHWYDPFLATCRPTSACFNSTPDGANSGARRCVVRSGSRLSFPCGTSSILVAYLHLPYVFPHSIPTAQDCPESSASDQRTEADSCAHGLRARATGADLMGCTFRLTEFRKRATEALSA